MSRIKRRVFELIVEPPERDVLANVIHAGILVLIAVTVLVGMVETVPALRARFGPAFDGFEVFSVLVFTVEYALRLWSCTEDRDRFPGAVVGRLRCATRPLTLIDLVAILPFYLHAFLPGLDLRFVRVLRLVRLFRLFRIDGLSASFRTLGTIFERKRYQLLTSMTTVLIVLVLASSVMYLLEHGEKNTPFTSVPASMWWGMITITTIGYGDMVPVTLAGRVVGMLVAFTGVLVLALPVAILGAGFIEEVDRPAPAAAAAPPAPAAPEPAPPAPRLDEAQLEWLARRVAELVRTPPR